MKITDATAALDRYFPSGSFDMESWKAYIKAVYPAAEKLCLDDYEETIEAGYSYEKDFKPILDNALKDKESLDELLDSFHKTTDRLDERIFERFGRHVDADIVLYLGLGNGAGWVTKIKDRTTILLGIEKIMELGWQEQKKMDALILHELGHAYHFQHGKRIMNNGDLYDELLWQLFSEGIAMCFEQELVDDADYYHQGKEWKKWCDENYGLIRTSFAQDLGKMSHQDQRYFGDWVSFCGHGDTGYYLGARFIRCLLKENDLNTLISYDMDMIRDAYERYMEEER